MELRISARNLNVSDRFKEYVSEKSGKVEQFAHRPQELNIKVTRHEHHASGPEDQVELTVYEAGHVVRAEARSADKFAAFDIAFGKLTERLRRAADKRKPHHGRHGSVGTSELTAEDFARLDVTPVDSDVLATKKHHEESSDDEPEFGHNPIVIRRKEFQDIKMSVDTALDRMELLGHDFFLFHDEATDKPSVVYKRKGWNYGVITLS